MAFIEDSKIKKYIEHIRFRNVDSEADKVYESIRSRISGEEVLQISRSPYWKYVAVAASVLLVITNSFFIFNGSKKREQKTDFLFGSSGCTWHKDPADTTE
ncbi:MAG: hypothetical protein LUG96_16650 [Tannerellaceae bacterium]|nr:hypothetical protein [Tannerellaceae bacterium]